jgi:hypothetical protein
MSRCRWLIASLPPSSASTRRPIPDDRDLPGASLFDLARGTAPRRTILSEYHATGAFIIRKGPFKYVYYAGLPPQLFDLDRDPQEARDLAREPGYQGLVADCETALRHVVDPDAANALAKADPGGAHRRYGRARGHHCPRQLRLFADAGDEACVQLTCSLPPDQEGQPRRVA